MAGRETHDVQGFWRNEITRGKFMLSFLPKPGSYLENNFWHSIPVVK